MKLSPEESARIWERFWSKVEKTSGCWLWAGGRYRASNGRKRYGQFTLTHGRPIQAHRVAYMLCKGEIPDGQLVRHICDNEPCVNPAHLILGTHADNKTDAVERGRHVHGERMHTAKLTEAQVLEIRRRRSDGELTSTLAAEFGVSDVNISAICKGQTWKHLPC